MYLFQIYKMKTATFSPLSHRRAPGNFKACNRFPESQKVVCKQHRTAAQVISTIMANITLVVGDLLYSNWVSLRMSLKEAKNRTLCTKPIGHLYTKQKYANSSEKKK